MAFSLRLTPGDVVGIIGPVGARTGAALALSGRLETTGGRARVAGALLPEAASRVRRRVTYLDLAHQDEISTALESVPAGQVVIVDSVDLVGAEVDRAALRALIERIRPEGAVLLGATSEDHLRDFSVDGSFAAPATTHEGSRV